MRASWAALEGSTCGPGSPGRGHFETFNLFSSSTENFVLLQHFFQLVHSAQCLILTTVALKLPLQSPRKETMRIKRNNYPMSERSQLHFDHLRIYDFWCLKVVFPLFAEFMWTRWNEKPYGWDVLGGRSDLYRLCSWYGPRLHSGDSILNPIIIFIFLSALFQNGKNTVCWNWFLSYNSISIY